MLVELRVRGLAVIRDARLELGPGLNVLTGETGAGKSLLVDALALLSGERADSSLVRPGADRCVVEGAFEVEAQRHRDTEAQLERLGVELEDGRIVLKREVQPSGRSRAWINGSPATVGLLGEVGRLLVDLHGQHEAQSLLRPEVQRAIVDSFGGAVAEAEAVAAAWDARERLRQERGDLGERQAAARRRADYLRHVAEEIARARPRAGELEALETELRRLGHAEELGRTAAELAETLDGDDRAASHTLARAARLLAALERIDPQSAAPWREMLDQALVNVEELARAVREYAEAVDLDPARLAELERRRDVLFRLDQKYGPGLERVVETGESARRELELLDTADTDLKELDRRLADADATFAAACKALSARRKGAARRLGAAVTRHLPELGMPDGRLSVALEPVEPAGRFGAEQVEFVCALNPGLPERSVAKAASGGELARLMLALKVELAAHDRIPTLVFDEVDAGVGGQVAGRLAEALHQVAAQRQTLVVTHLPAIAARASRHIVVEKEVKGGETVARARIVEEWDRIEELARMLGGGPAARRHAEEMIAAAAVRR